MSSETRANFILCLGVFIAIYQNTGKFNILELVMTCLSCSTCICFSCLPYQLGNDFFHRIDENGLLYCLLLPLINLMSNATVGGNYVLSIFYNGLILTSLVPAVQGVLQFKGEGGESGPHIFHIAALSFIVSVAYWIVFLFTRADLLTLSCTLVLLIIQLWLQNNIPLYLPKSFSYAELSILCHGIICFLLNFSMGMFLPAWFPLKTLTKTEVHVKEMLLFSQIACVSCAVVVVAYVSMGWFKIHWSRFYILLFSSFFIFTLPLLSTGVSTIFLSWVFQTIFRSTYAIGLVIFWIVCSMSAVALATSYNPKISDSKGNITKRSRNTRVRKIFHILIFIVYLPGFLFQPELLFLASSCVLVLLVLMEVVRIFNIPPLGKLMRKSFSVFLDDQDKGWIILTPIYLLIGCSFPLWLSIGRQVPTIISLAGLISLGIGDSVASYVGSKYGKYHWKDSSKTIEGTLSSIFSQLLFLVLLQLTGLHVIGKISIFDRQVLTAVILASLLEAFTSQIDNLVLPLFMHLLLL